MAGKKFIIKVLQGVFIGLALILPGLSAGTVILILGFYRSFIDDLTNIHLKPYLPLAGGVLAGGLAGVFAIGYLLERFHLVVTGFLLGLLLASIPAVINHGRRPGLRPWPFFCAAAGFVTTWFIICEPTRTFTVLPPGGHFHFFIGGVLSSATMLLPGVSGSSVLIIMNLYDDVIQAVSHLQWIKIAILIAGFIVGLFGLARLLSALYRRYGEAIAFLLAGLILGSTRALLPETFTLLYLLAAASGALLVFLLTRGKRLN